MMIRQVDNYNIFFSDRTQGDVKDNNLFSDFIMPGEQVHGNEILIVDNIDKVDNRFKGDGFISNLSNQKFAVRVADCNGIVLMGNSYFSILHAGWRGLYGGILENSIDILRKKQENIKNLKVFVGPSIRSCCYVVGEDFKEKFKKKHLLEKDGFIYLDMISFIKDNCIEHGVDQENILIEDICTFCQKDKFPSYRSGDRNLRMLIGVEKLSG